MNEHGKSDGPVVPEKSPNKAGQPAAEEMEGRGPAKGNSHQQNATRTQCRNVAQSALERIRLVSSIAVHRPRYHPRQEPDAVVPLVRICGGGRGQPRSLLRLPVIYQRPPPTGYAHELVRKWTAI